MSAYSQAQNKASQRYRAAKIKRIPLDVPIDDYNAFKAACDHNGDKVNTVLRQAMENYVDNARDNK